MRSKYLLWLVLPFLFLNSVAAKNKETHPNVILILTDDQGYGDLGATGNKLVKTPVLDEFAKNSIRFTNFYVSPVCAPTRSSLMTGRQSLRTGVRDTYNGGSIMASTEVTIAEMLKQANYKTGIFGKWHLGDNYPCRPTDQGFDESLIHLAGGMGQPGDITTYFKFDKSYFDPVLWKNNKQQAFKGYCTDIFADNAIDFIERNKDSSFFCYLAFNAPHTPLQLPEKYYNIYKDIDPTQALTPNSQVKMNKKHIEDAKKVYGMVTNIDDNLGKLFKKLEQLKLDKNTIIIFMTDNGPEQPRYIGEMRGKKGSVYRGGNRVPFYLSYPAKYKNDQDIKTPAAHVDILPTLADLCHVDLPVRRKIDGKNLVPLMDGKEVAWTNRPFFFYWSRRYPELYRNIALQKGKYKFVGQADYDAKLTDFELYNLEKDPRETTNIIRKNLDLAQDMKNELDMTYDELVNSENLINPQPITIGSEYENPVFLNRNDASGQRFIWTQEQVYGKWDVDIKEGNYNIKFKFIKPLKPNGTMYLETNRTVHQIKVKQETDVIEMKNIHFNALKGDFIPFYKQSHPVRIFPLWVEVEKI